MKQSSKKILLVTSIASVLFMLYYGYRIFRERDTSQYTMELNQHWSNSNEWKELYRISYDSCLSWVNDEDAPFRLRDSVCVWQLDSLIVFNESKSNALLFLSLVIKDRQAVYDVVRMIGAEYKNDHWSIFPKSFPTMGFKRTYLNEGQPFTFAQLQHLAAKEISNGGYINWLTVEPNYRYVDEMVALHAHGRQLWRE